MSSTRILSLLLLTSLGWFIPGQLSARAALRGAEAADQERRSGARHTVELPSALATMDRLDNAKLRNRHSATSRPNGGGVKEEIPAKYLKRYQDWKNEFLTTETGRRQWEAYAEQPQFTLTITISHDNRNGGGTGKYKWDDAGRLISATITLGCRMDEGYPSPVYYPVMNSLAPRQFAPGISGSLLAATKIAHEFGHVIRMTKTDGALYREQTRLVPVYNSILQSNGHKANDPRLIALAQQMGGTPMEIWADREYWGEANAMLYLRDRMARESFQCSLFSRIKRYVELYARNYEERFVQIAQSTSPPYRCTWQ
jgi:hypothetical protein